MRMPVGGFVALGLAALATGCVSESQPDASACAAPQIVLELRLTAEELTPAPSVCRDQEVTLRIASEVDGVIDFHGYDEAIPSTEVVAGETLELTFDADRAGQFPIEVHFADDSEGTTVGVFTVNEP